jgi:hypothetical protein
VSRFKKSKRPPMSPSQYKVYKVQQALGSDTVDEMNAMGPEALDKVILESVKSVEQAAEEMEANEKYQEAKRAAKIAAQPKKDFEDGLKDLKKRQNARIAYARHLLASQGKS